MGTSNIQDTVLNQLRKEKIPCAIRLTNGFQIKSAIVEGFDNFVILVSTEGEKQMMLYKHAISSLTPGRSVSCLPEK